MIFCVKRRLIFDNKKVVVLIISIYNMQPKTLHLPKSTRHSLTRLGFVVLGIMIISIVTIIGFGGGPTNGKVGNIAGILETKDGEKFEDTFVVGEVIELDGNQLIVNKVTRNFDTGNQFSVPKTGQEYVVVDVEIRNNGKNKISYNPFDFKIQDSQGNIESTGLFVGLDNPISSGELSVGGKITGQLGFEVPKDDLDLVLTYEVSFWSNKEIKVKL